MTKADIFADMISALIDNTRETNGVPPFECMQVARLVGPCEFTFYSEDNAVWVRIVWQDRSYIVLGVGDEQ